MNRADEYKKLLRQAKFWRDQAEAHTTWANERARAGRLAEATEHRQLAETAARNAAECERDAAELKRQIEED